MFIIHQAPTLSKPARLSTSVVITALVLLSDEANPRKKLGLILNAPPSSPPPDLSVDSVLLAFCSVMGYALVPACCVSLIGLGSCSFSTATSPS